MFQKNQSLLLVLLLLITSSLFACPLEDGSLGGYFPSEQTWELSYPVDDFNSFDTFKSNKDKLDRVSFEYIYGEVIGHYRPWIEKLRGGKLETIKDWDNEEPNAYAGINPVTGNPRVALLGGLARIPLMTRDALALVLCHEVGHLIGGYPHKRPSKPVFAAAEAQADYFSTAKCFRAVFGKESADSFFDNFAFEVEESFGEKKCDSVYQNSDEYYTCVRTLKAAEDLGKVAAYIARKRDPMARTPKLNTPSKKVVRDHIRGYPSNQCRVDTMMQGALCELGNALPYGIENDYALGYCTRKAGYKVGVRPLCWFNPADAEIDLLFESF